MWEFFKQLFNFPAAQQSLTDTGYPAVYFGALVVAVLALALSGGPLLASVLVAPRKREAAKDAPYECGVPPIGSAHEKQMVRFYIVAMLFVLFDVETAFLFPWAVAYDSLGLFGLIEMFLFILVLLFGYIYAWKKEALDWVY
jgi:NADH-quinone oxidoreductase subunit A